MTVDEQRKLVETTVKSTIKEIRRLRGDERTKHLHNTEELLKNYRLLKDHVEYAVCSPGDVRTTEERIHDLEQEFYAEYDQEFLQKHPDLFIDSILKSRLRTALMVAHLDSMLTQLRLQAKRDNKQVQYKMFEQIYLHGRGYEDVGAEMNYAPSSVYRNVSRMTERLSVLLWGSDGLRLW